MILEVRVHPELTRYATIWLQPAYLSMRMFHPQRLHCVIYSGIRPLFPRHPHKSLRDVSVRFPNFVQELITILFVDNMLRPVICGAFPSALGQNSGVFGNCEWEITLSPGAWPQVIASRIGCYDLTLPLPMCI